MLNRKRNRRTGETTLKTLQGRRAVQNASKQIFEALENRQLMSTVTVTAGSDWMSAINNSKAGDTIKFTAGTYSLNNTTLTARTYVGASGVTLTGSTLNLAGGADISGVNLNGTAINIVGDGVNIHGDTITGSTSINAGTASNTQIVHNTFNSTRNYCVNGYPGNNTIVEYNKVDLRNAVTGGADSNGEEWLHFISGSSGISISNNYIIGNTMRWAIELQSGMQNLKVDNNYITAQAGSAISCATGGDATAPYGHQGKNIDISGNVLLDAHTPDISDCALELMGDSGLVVHDNYFGGYGTGILNGTGGQANQSAVTRNNVLFSREANYNKEQFLWTVPDLISTGDRTYRMGDPAIPAPPAAPTNVGAGNDGSTVGTGPTVTPVSTTATPTTFVGTSPSTSEIDLSWKDNSGGKATYVVQRKSTHGGDGYVTVATLGTGVTSYKDTSNIQGSWEYDYVIAAVQGGVSSAAATATVQAQMPVTSVGSGSGPVATPTTATKPTNVNGVGVSSSEIDLTWTDNNAGAATYILQRKSTHGADAYVTIATLATGTTSYKDTNNVTTNWEYDYLLTAVVGQSTSTAVYAHAQALSAGAVGTSPIPVGGTTGTPSPTTGGDWTDADLGAGQTSGSSLVAKGTYRVSSGTSSDAAGTSHFIYEQTSGNASVVARVTGNSSVSNFGSAGVSMRAGTDDSSASVSLAISDSGDVTLVTTNGNGTASEFDAGAGSVGSRWLKLVRSGGTVTGYYSNDGSSWQRVGSATLTLPESLDVGLTVASQADGSEGVAWFRNVAIKSGASVSIKKGSTSKAIKAAAENTAGNGLTARIYANAKLKGAAITRTDAAVNFNWGNATPDASVTSAPYSVKWTGLVEAPTSDTYTFTVHSDSGVKLWVNHKLVIADWTKTSTGDESGTIKLLAGHKYNIKMEYTEPTVQDSTVSLLWSNSTQGLEVIPQSNLFASAA